MGDHYQGGQYLFFLGRGACLLLLAVVGDLASTLPCGGQSLCVGDSRGLLGEQSVCVRGQSWTVGGTVGVCWFC
jgi:hypothetical protein